MTALLEREGVRTAMPSTVPPMRMSSAFAGVPLVA